MAGDIELLNVVAIDERGSPVLAPLSQWKLSYSAAEQAIEVRCLSYVKRYRLKFDLASVTPGEQNEKIAVGKTLGRLALTGLLQGRHVAAADLRWRGLNRDRSICLNLIFKDTTIISLELNNGEAEQLLKAVPESLSTDVAYQAALATHKRVKAMAKDGSRVLDELTATIAEKNSQISSQQSLVETGATFDERNGAKEKMEQLRHSLTEVELVRNAVVFEIARANPESAKIQKASEVVNESRPAEPIQTPSPPAVPKTLESPRVNSAPGVLFKIIAIALGAFVGFLTSLISVIIFGPFGVLAIPVLTIGGGWIGPKVLASLLATRAR